MYGDYNLTCRLGSLFAIAIEVQLALTDTWRSGA